VRNPARTRGRTRPPGAGTAAGPLRDDVEPEDVLSSIVGVFLTTAAPQQRAQAGRMLDLLMDGLRARA
jgi:hypothetical protein